MLEVWAVHAGAHEIAGRSGWTALRAFLHHRQSDCARPVGVDRVPQPALGAPCTDKVSVPASVTAFNPVPKSHLQKEPLVVCLCGRVFVVGFLCVSLC